jgi:hypothetical protein
MECWLEVRRKGKKALNGNALTIHDLGKESYCTHNIMGLVNNKQLIIKDFQSDNL